MIFIFCKLTLVEKKDIYIASYVAGFWLRNMKVIEKIRKKNILYAAVLWKPQHITLICSGSIGIAAYNVLYSAAPIEPQHML